MSEGGGVCLTDGAGALRRRLEGSNAIPNFQLLAPGRVSAVSNLLRKSSGLINPISGSWQLEPLRVNDPPSRVGERYSRTPPTAVPSS